MLAPERETSERDEIPYIAVAAFDKVDGLSDVLTYGIGRNSGLTVKKLLYTGNGLVIHLFALVIQELDAVVVERVMACRNHDSAIESVVFRHECHRRCGGNVQQVGVSTGRSDAGCKGIFQHIGGAAGLPSLRREQ